VPEFRGIGVSHGIAIGRALVLGRWELKVPRYRLAEDEVRGELRRFWSARRRAREEIQSLREKAASTLGEKYSAIFDAHLMILDDRKLGRETMRRIRDQRMNAEWALASVVERLMAAFRDVEDPYLRERSGDIADVHDRLQRILAGEENRHDRVLDLQEETIIVARTLSPSDALWLHQPLIVGFVTEEGGRTSHTAILANALEIPAVLGVDGITRETRDGDLVVVDGSHGHVAVRPDEETLAAYREEREELQRIDLSLESERGPVTTRDGVELTIAANIEFPEEMETVRRVGAQGVGLYRSEFLFLTTAPRLPTEDDHLAAYRKIAAGAGGYPVTIRTFDLGGEKYFHEVLEEREPNPVLGLRAVRFCLRRPEILRTQLRALLRVAAEAGNVRVLVPMITTLDEWRQVRAMVEDCRRELEEQGIDAGTPPLGPMVEVPAAAMVAEALAAESDFLSIGTNDLIQYTLAVDRGNRSVAHLYDPWHPAVLELVRRTIEAGHGRGVSVSLCGELASDPLGALTLLGLGLEEFSCNPVVIPEIRTLLRAADARRARQVVGEALGLPTGGEIRQRLSRAFGELMEQVLGQALHHPGHDH